MVIKVDSSTKFISIGDEIDGELRFTDINFIRNLHHWGVCIVDDDGEIVTTQIVPHDESIEINDEIHILIQPPSNGVIAVEIE